MHQPVAQGNVQSCCQLGARAVDAIRHGISGACRDVAQAHSCCYSCHVAALRPQVQQAVHDLLEQAITSNLRHLSNQLFCQTPGLFQ